MHSVFAIRFRFVIPASLVAMLLTLSASGLFAQEDPVEAPKEAPATPAEKKADDEKKEPEAPAAGHSNHGEIFNEGPRHSALPIEGTGQVSFPIQCAWEEGQKFFNQGVGQLHGFWYYEAERTFRQIASRDPKCAMAYWGMALAN